MNSAETKSRIRNELLSLMREKPVETIKVTEITEKLGISRTTFYSYYNSIHDVLQEIENMFISDFERFNRDFHGSPFDDKYFNIPYPTITETLRFLNRYRSLLSILTDENNGDPIFRYKCKKLINEEFYKKAISQDYIHVKNKLAEVYMTGGHFEMFLYYFSNDLKMDYEEMAVMIYTIMFRPYRP